MNTEFRPCPLCGNTQSTVIYTQHFANHFAHPIAVCTLCGFVFVNTLPSREFYDSYYHTMSKYDINREEWFHTKIVKQIQRYITKDQPVLDVGCATGHLLSLLKQNGYTNLLGIDPSPHSKTIAKKTYDVSVDTENIYTYISQKKYSILLFSAVLEHLTDIRTAIKQATHLLTDDGYLSICVPDASSFDKNPEEPFGEFSTEHINFFSPSSLSAFMNDYQNILMKSDGKAIYSLWKKEPLTAVMKHYISISERKMKTMQDFIHSLPEQLIVWGAGALTQRLLETTSLSKKVFLFVDKDTKLHQTTLHNIPIASPDTLSSYSNPILIMSYKFKKEIVAEIKKRKLPNTVFAL